MNRYLFMSHLIPMLNKPGFLNSLVAVALRVLSAVVVLVSLASIFTAGKVTFSLQAHSIMGGILFQIFYIVAIYSVVHAILIRARDIEHLPTSEFMVLPMGSLLLKLIGEVYAFFVAMTAIGGGIFVWFTNQPVSAIMSPVPWFFPVPHSPNFTGGITIMLGGTLLAAAVLIGFYMLSELFTALIRSQQRTISAPPRQIANYTKSRFGG